MASTNLCVRLIQSFQDLSFDGIFNPVEYTTPSSKSRYNQNSAQRCWNHRGNSQLYSRFFRGFDPPLMLYLSSDNYQR